MMRPCSSGIEIEQLGWSNALAQPHVFISYVRENRDAVDRLAEELRNSGVTVWLDRDDIEGGARWKEAIKSAIRSGKFFIACFSKESNKRDISYMREEITIAIDELRLRPSDKNWFIPVLLNECNIPSRRISAVEDLSDLQVIKIYDDWDDGKKKILRAMKLDDP
jgi:hypothetical protein